MRIHKLDRFTRLMLTVGPFQDWLTSKWWFSGPLVLSVWIMGCCAFTVEASFCLQWMWFWACFWQGVEFIGWWARASLGEAVFTPKPNTTWVVTCEFKSPDQEQTTTVSKSLKEPQ